MTVQHIGIRSISGGSFRILTVNGAEFAMMRAGESSIYAVPATEQAIEGFDPYNPIGTFVSDKDDFLADRSLYHRPTRLMPLVAQAFA